ncbi:MAG: PucR family transcriptional regulator ligand-binding domain-containing protein, partial [Bacillota bacterium]|nr:PucR family transcriptional regulator ligand-binding domain-containing protein [Bacillota bacterium]
MFITKDLTVAELLKTSDFCDTILVGGEGGLCNVITWVHPLEIVRDAHIWIDEGVLILCSAVGINKEDELTNFFRELLYKKISCFCLQINFNIDCVPPEMIDLANKHNCPLIVFSRWLRFMDMIQHIVPLLLENTSQYLVQEMHQLSMGNWVIDWLEGR